VRRQFTGDHEIRPPRPIRRAERGGPCLCTNGYSGLLRTDAQVSNARVICELNIVAFVPVGVFQCQLPIHLAAPFPALFPRKKSSKEKHLPLDTKNTKKIVSLQYFLSVTVRIASEFTTHLLSLRSTVTKRNKYGREVGVQIKAKFMDHWHRKLFVLGFASFSTRQEDAHQLERERFGVPEENI
jgi:hypothetical protein